MATGRSPGDLGAKKVTITEDGVVSSYSSNISTEELFALYYALDEHGIGPKVLSKKGNSITLEEIDLLAPNYTLLDSTALDPKLLAWFRDHKLDSETVIRGEVRRVMNLLHDKIGYCHGDSHLGNMGYRIVGSEFHILLFDLDHAFQIAIGKYMPSVLRWIREGYGSEMGYEELIEHDFHNALEMIDFPPKPFDWNHV